MASKETTSTVEDLRLSVASVADDLLESYQQMHVPMRRYMLVILLPATGFMLLTVVGALLINAPTFVRVPVPLLGLLLFGAALFYPKILLSQERKALNNRLHLVITHMTVLSTTRIDRMEVFRALAEEDEYGALADEMRRVVQLVDTWNQSLDDALRRRARQVPSDALADFFDRLAYTLGAGQPLEDFLLSEQEQVMQNYETVYTGSLENLEVMKDLYMSMILSMTFALVFAVVLPILTGTNPTMTVSAVILLFIFVQSGFYLTIRTMAPHDPLWYQPEGITTELDTKLIAVYATGISLTLVLAFVSLGGLFGLSPITLEMLLPMSSVPLPLYVAVPITPLLIPGIYVRQAEKSIAARDDEYPSFIRALGAAEGAKQSTTSMVLSTLRKKDFGKITNNIDDLYKRLNMRIEPSSAWRYFTADCRSYLIQKFSEMFLIGREMGGSPKQLGELISENMNVVLQLRQRRSQAATTLIGLLYGISAAATFAFFIGLQVVNILASMSLDLTTSAEFNVNSLINTSVYNIPLIEFLLIVIIVFNALLSSLMIRETDGGHKLNAYMHFVILTWLGSVIAILTKSMVSSFLTI
ncbi:archaellar assembly protein FlaJ [Halorientalis sp.]|uniref:archaellar assembly protein FlaJ n=1 Tax=Halorientalis sp. TaxID=1931229 RepID=UPI002608FEEA|nr:archaellar assembly protein FlaJ [Halorientalis sp.]